MELERKNEFESNEKRPPANCDVIPAKAGIQGRDGGLDSPVKPENDIPDLRPEFCRYRDEGCELAESCLNCPFAKCIYDEPGGKQRWLKRLRAREIARLHVIDGKKVKELSEMFGISQRTVQRALKTALGGANQRKGV